MKQDVIIIGAGVIGLATAERLLLQGAKVYMDDQNVPRALALARKQGEKFDIMTTSFFLNHRSFRSAPSEGLPRWQEKLYISMARGATNATEFYRLPTNRVLELGEHLAI